MTNVVIGALRVKMLPAAKYHPFRKGSSSPVWTMKAKVGCISVQSDYSTYRLLTELLE